MFPLEASNLAHWYIETTEMKMHFVAPQFIVMDRTQAKNLDPMRIVGLKFRKGAPEEKRVYCSLLVAWTYF